MILATRDDYDQPHCDWSCKSCGVVYSSSGYPSPERCLNGHAAGWQIADEQHQSYVAFLESLDVGDGVVLVSQGPAPLMGPVKEVGENYIVTNSIDSPARKVRWGGGTIEQARTDRAREFWEQVYHIESVAIDGDVV